MLHSFEPALSIQQLEQKLAKVKNENVKQQIEVQPKQLPVKQIQQQQQNNPFSFNPTNPFTSDTNYYLQGHTEQNDKVDMEYFRYD